METNDWKQLYKVLCNKIKNIYFQWHRENMSDDENEDGENNVIFEYLKKINDIDKNIETKIRKIKEFIIKHIQTTLVIVE